MWPLTVHWYGDRLDPNYAPHPVENLQALLTAADLVSDFWQLT